MTNDYFAESLLLTLTDFLLPLFFFTVFKSRKVEKVQNVLQNLRLKGKE